MPSPLSHGFRKFVLLLVVILAAPWLIAADPANKESADLVATLKPWQKLIGSWRGIGQPKRGSNKGTWQETAEVAWKLNGPDRGIVLTVADGKLWSAARLALTDQPQEVLLELQLEGDQRRQYRGPLAADRLILESPADDQGEVHRLTLSWLGNDRAIWLFEKRLAQQSFYQRVAEVAYQRQGTKLAAKDGSGPECVVTGGLGTIAVMHAGKTYYVCCTGCRDAFNDDPDAILAEYAARKQEGMQQ
ncbi:hypothetical protein GC163_07950 [bacterium]|nr:hypothetical protein [bacterium]